MTISKRLAELEKKENAVRWRCDSAVYKEGEPIKYDGLTFYNEDDLMAYGKSINTHILPICIVNSKQPNA